MRSAQYRKVCLSKVTKAVKGRIQDSNLDSLLPEAVSTTIALHIRGERKVLDPADPHGVYNLFF